MWEFEYSPRLQGPEISDTITKQERGLRDVLYGEKILSRITKPRHTTCSAGPRQLRMGLIPVLFLDLSSFQAEEGKRYLA